KHCGRRFHVFSRNLEYFGGRIYDQASEPARVLDHQNAVLFLQAYLFFPEALAQVHDRDDLAPQVDHALEIVGRVRDSGDLRDSHDLMQRSDGHAIGLASHLEAHDMEFATHGSLELSSGSGTPG